MDRGGRAFEPERQRQRRGFDPRAFGILMRFVCGLLRARRRIDPFREGIVDL